MNRNNSSGKLKKNIIIFSLANLGNKLISFILVPIYTYYLSREAFGMIDLTTTTIMMLLPVVTASSHEAVLRFVLDKHSQYKNIIYNSFTISLLGFLISLTLIPLFTRIGIQTQYIFFLYVILFLQIINQILSQYCRAIGKIKEFAYNGIIITLLIGLFNIGFIVNFKMDIRGYFLSLLYSYVISNCYLYFVTYKTINIKEQKLDLNEIKDILKYSVPLIPNSIMWWLTNGASRFIINWILGISANGLFAVSSKIPTVISVFNQIFSQAWQLSAFEAYNENSTSKYYSIVFSYYYKFLMTVISALILILKPSFKLLFSSLYFGAWEPVPFLLLGTLFSSLSAFIGVNYTASKNTNGIFKTSVIGGFLSVVFNFIFIPHFGLLGAGISSMISFFSMFVLRLIDTKHLVKISFDIKEFCFQIILLFIQSMVLFLYGLIFLPINLIIFILIIYTNRKLFHKLVEDLLNMHKRSNLYF